MWTAASKIDLSLRRHCKYVDLGDSRQHFSLPGETEGQEWVKSFFASAVEVSQGAWRLGAHYMAVDWPTWKASSPKSRSEHHAPSPLNDFEGS